MPKTKFSDTRDESAVDAMTRFLMAGEACYGRGCAAARKFAKQCMAERESLIALEGLAV